MDKKRLPPAKARTTRRVVGEMNGYEQRYETEVLIPAQKSGEIVAYWFERFTFRIADNCRYTPDFIVHRADGMLEAHEVKGFWEEDAKVKIKVAADIFPFRFIAVRPKPKKEGGGWEIKEF